MFESTENISAIEDFVFLTHLGELTAWTNQWYILNWDTKKLKTGCVFSRTVAPHWISELSIKNGELCWGNFPKRRPEWSSEESVHSPHERSMLIWQKFVHQPKVRLPMTLMFATDHWCLNVLNLILLWRFVGWMTNIIYRQQVSRHVVFKASPIFVLDLLKMMVKSSSGEKKWFMMGCLCCGFITRSSNHHH